MIKKFKDYDQTKAYGDYEKLPKGGYVMRILDAVNGRWENRKWVDDLDGDVIKVSCDIDSGEYHGFFKRDYLNQQSEDKKWRCVYYLNIPQDDGSEKDAWTKRRFKTFTEALEDSNSGYHFDWDEKKFVDKVIGGLFNEREFEGRDGNIARATNFAQVCPVEKIKDGTYKLPADKLLDRTSPATSTSTGFLQIPDNIDEELPFK